MTRIAARVAAPGVVLGVLLVAIACQKSYHLRAPESFPESISREIAGRDLHEGENLLVDLKTHKLFGEIHKGELQKLRLEVEGEKPDEIPLGSIALTVTSPAPPGDGEAPMSCQQKYDLCYSKCRRTVLGPTIDCCFLKCDFAFLKCDTHNHPGGWGGGFVIY